MAIILCCHLWLVICNILVIFLIHSSAGSQGEAHSSIVASAKTSSLPVSTLVKKPLPTIELAVEADGISLKKRGKQVKVVINTVSREIDVIGIPKRTLKHKSRMYYAIFGHFTLPLGDYLLLVSDAQTVQNIHVDSIQEVKGFELVKIPGSGKSAASLLLQPKLLQEHRKAVKELFFALRRHTFHFSTGKYNILRTVQSNHLNYPGAEDKFFWNKMALSPFISTNATDFITPLCNSWIGSAVIEEADNRYRVTLISRRSKDRQGPRYIKRGVDEEGNVANFVEVEQIVEKLDSDDISSYVQIRGSIPLFWQQSKPWKLRPPVEVTGTLNKQIIAARRHLDSLVWYYLLQIKQRMATNTHVLVEEEVPSLISINLIDKKEGQGMLGMLWAKVFNDIGSPVNKENDKLEKEEILYDLTEIAANAKKGVDKKVEETEDSTDNDNDDQSMRKLVDKFATDLKTIDRKIITSQDFISSISTSNETVSLCHKLVWFDYHSLCHAADQSALLGLFMHLQCHFNSSDYLFLRKEEDAKINYQRSILRTNCMDCLDRTNVVQTTLSRWVLMKQIESLSGDQAYAGSFQSRMTLPNQESEDAFRRLWAENGDHISMMYAGSRAMKRDVTKTGIRTKRGMLDDAMAFGRRYFMNNYRDSGIQKAVDAVIKVHSRNSLRKHSPIPLGYERVKSDLDFNQNLQVDVEHTLTNDESNENFPQLAHSHGEEDLVVESEVEPSVLSYGHIDSFFEEMIKELKEALSSAAMERRKVSVKRKQKKSRRLESKATITASSLIADVQRESIFSEAYPQSTNEQTCTEQDEKSKSTGTSRPDKNISNAITNWLSSLMNLLDSKKTLATATLIGVVVILL